MKLLYTYYKEETRAEHLLYAKEIAEAFYVTVSYNPYHVHKRMMSWLLDFRKKLSVLLLHIILIVGDLVGYIQMRPQVKL